MALPEDTRIRRIRTVSTVMSWFTLFGGLLIVATILVITIDDEILTATLRSELRVDDALLASGGFVVMLTWFVALIPLLPMIWGFYNAWILFRGFRGAEFFTPRSGRRLRNIGWSVVMLVAVGFVTDAALSVLTTWHRGAGQRELAIGLEGTDILGIVVGMLLVVVGWLMAEAALIDDENKQFV